MLLFICIQILFFIYTWILPLFTPGWIGRLRASGCRCPAAAAQARFSRCANLAVPAAAVQVQQALQGGAARRDYTRFTANSTCPASESGPAAGQDSSSGL